MDDRTPTPKPVDNSSLCVFHHMGNLNYPGDCENHHLARDEVVEFFTKKRERFGRRLVRRWGSEVPILEDREGETQESLLQTFHKQDFFHKNFLPLVMFDREVLQSLALVCKACALGIREVSYAYPNFEKHKITIGGEYYEVTLAKGAGGTIHTIKYKCACQLWNESIEDYHYVDWELVAPENDDFEDYLYRQDVRDAVSNLPGDNDF